jgi:hypothetical protein
MHINQGLEHEMKKSLFGLMFVSLSVFSVNAISACHEYDYAEVQLKGEVLLKAPTDLPKGAGSHRNPKEKHTFLKLDRPICMTAGTNSYESAEENQVEVTLYTLRDAGLGKYAGKRVAVNGVLMHSFVSDAHTPLQFVVKDITAISSVRLKVE